MLEKKNLERELNGVKKRRYLTEPPDEYRTPAEDGWKLALSAKRKQPRTVL